MSAAIVAAGKMLIDEIDLELLREVGKMFGYGTATLDNPETLRTELKEDLELFEDRESGIRGKYLYFYFRAHWIKRVMFSFQRSPRPRPLTA